MSDTFILSLSEMDMKGFGGQNPKPMGVLIPGFLLCVKTPCKISEPIGQPLGLVFRRKKEKKNKQLLKVLPATPKVSARISLGPMKKEVIQ
jgi:hypothetical protein